MPAPPLPTDTTLLTRTEPGGQPTAPNSVGWTCCPPSTRGTWWPPSIQSTHRRTCSARIRRSRLTLRPRLTRRTRLGRGAGGALRTTDGRGWNGRAESLSYREPIARCGSPLTPPCWDLTDSGSRLAGDTVAVAIPAIPVGRVVLLTGADRCSAAVPSRMRTDLRFALSGSAQVETVADIEWRELDRTSVSDRSTAAIC